MGIGTRGDPAVRRPAPVRSLRYTRPLSPPLPVPSSPARPFLTRAARKLRRVVAKVTGRGPSRPVRDSIIAALPTGSRGAEIGVHEGDFAADLLRVVQPRELHLIDPWAHETDATYSDAWYGGQAGGAEAMDARYERVRARFAAPIAAGQVVVHRMPSAEAAPALPDGGLDWVYVDGNHLYEFVLADLEAYFPKLAPGGVLIGDDYGVEGWWENGVQRAADAFVAARPELTLEVRGDQFLIRKP